MGLSGSLGAVAPDPRTKAHSSVPTVQQVVNSVPCPGPPGSVGAMEGGVAPDPVLVVRLGGTARLYLHAPLCAADVLGDFPGCTFLSLAEGKERLSGAHPLERGVTYFALVEDPEPALGTGPASGSAIGTGLAPGAAIGTGSASGTAIGTDLAPATCSVLQRDSVFSTGSAQGVRSTVGAESGTGTSRSGSLLGTPDRAAGASGSFGSGRMARTWAAAGPQLSRSGGGQSSGNSQEAVAGESGKGLPVVGKETKQAGATGHSSPMQPEVTRRNGQVKPEAAAPRRKVFSIGKLFGRRERKESFTASPLDGPIPGKGEQTELPIDTYLSSASPLCAEPTSIPPEGVSHSMQAASIQPDRVPISMPAGVSSSLQQPVFEAPQKQAGVDSSLQQLIPQEHLLPQQSSFSGTCSGQSAFEASQKGHLLPQQSSLIESYSSQSAAPTKGPTAIRHSSDSLSDVLSAGLQPEARSFSQPLIPQGQLLPHQFPPDTWQAGLGAQAGSLTRAQLSASPDVISASRFSGWSQGSCASNSGVLARLDQTTGLASVLESSHPRDVSTRSLPSLSPYQSSISIQGSPCSGDPHRQMPMLPEAGLQPPQDQASHVAHASKRAGRRVVRRCEEVRVRSVPQPPVFPHPAFSPQAGFCPQTSFCPQTMQQPTLLNPAGPQYPQGCYPVFP